MCRPRWQLRKLPKQLGLWRVLPVSSAQRASTKGELKYKQSWIGKGLENFLETKVCLVSVPSAMKKCNPFHERLASEAMANGADSASS